MARCRAAVSLAEAVGALDKKAKRVKSDPNDTEAGEHRAEAYRKWLEITESEYKMMGKGNLPLKEAFDALSNVKGTFPDAWILSH